MSFHFEPRAARRVVRSENSLIIFLFIRSHYALARSGARCAVLQSARLSTGPALRWAVCLSGVSRNECTRLRTRPIEGSCVGAPPRASAVGLGARGSLQA